MPRVHKVEAARKDYPEADIKKGETYYWWKFRHGGKRMQKTPPKPSQLTQSAFLSTLYDLQEQVQQAQADSSLADLRDEVVQGFRDLAEECESNRSNMPDSLQDSDTGQLLQDRADRCNEIADELEGLDLDEFQEDDSERDETDCPDCQGTGQEQDEEGNDTDKDCPTCQGTGQVPDADAEAKNSDGETEEEYWAAKLEELQGVDLSVDA